MSDPTEERRERFSTPHPPSTQSRARATVRGVRQATGADFTLAQLVEEALERYCAHLERTYNNERPWSAATSPLPPGRL